MIIDDFLPESQADEILQECGDLKKFFVPAAIIDDANHQNKTDVKYRKNDVVYIDNVFAFDRKHCLALKYLEGKMFSKEFKDFMSEGDSIFAILPYTNSNETVLSRYGMCDFYGWHQDIHPGRICSRIFTCVYYVNRVPEKFTGGELTFSNKPDGEKKLTVKPKHNRAVFFGTSTYHKVGNVRVESEDPMDFRFSFNCWFGFKNKRCNCPS